MEEFLKELEEKLKEKNIENWEEILDKYEKRFHFGLESGLSDEEIIRMLGSIEDIIDSYSKKEDTDMDGLKIHVSTVLDDVFFERSKDDTFHVYLENINENSYKIIKNEKEINIEYITYMSNLVRSAIAPDTIVADVAQKTVSKIRNPSTGRSPE